MNKPIVSKIQKRLSNFRKISAQPRTRDTWTLEHWLRHVRRVVFTFSGIDFEYQKALVGYLLILVVLCK